MKTKKVNSESIDDGTKRAEQAKNIKNAMNRVDTKLDEYIAACETYNDVYKTWDDKPKARKPLPNDAKKILDILIKLPENEALSPKEILTIFHGKNGKISESTLRKRLNEDLPPYGVMYDSKSGYYARKPLLDY